VSPEEARLLALERRVYRLPVLDLERRVVGLEQGLAQSWSWGVGYQTPTPTPTYDPTLTYIIFRCWGEGGAAFSGCPCAVYSGATLVDSGNTGSDGTYTTAGLTPAFYSVETSASGKTNVPRGGTSAFGTPGVYTVDLLIYATGTTLSLADSYYGNFTLAWDATNKRWSVNWTTGAGGHPGSPACGSCPAWSATPCTSIFQNGIINSFTVTFRTSTGGTPPAGCPTNLAGSTTNMAATISRGAQVYTPGFSGTFSYASGSNLYCANTTTWVVTQP
jgi:hypothetical protein